MIQILAEATIADLPKFLEVFSTIGLEVRRRYGCLASRIFKIAEDERRIFILFDWASRESFDAFQNAAEVRETMKSSGTLAPPKFTILEKTAEFPG